MNIQTPRSKKQRKTVQKDSAWRGFCSAILKLITVLLIIFAVANSYIYLNQEIQRIERDNASVSKKMEIIDREIKSLKNDYESASSYQVISAQIKKFGLNLREPHHSQTHYITLNTAPLTDTEIANLKNAPVNNNANVKIAEKEKNRYR